MRTKNICRFFGLFASLLLVLTTTTISAQTREELSFLSTLSQGQVQQNVVKSFEQKFKNATTINWYQTKENNVLAKYTQNGQTQYALFSVNGKLIRQFTYGTERNLPVEIHNLFRGKYWKGTVVNVANVKQDSRDIWIIYAQQGSNSFSVKIEDGEMEEL